MTLPYTLSGFTAWTIPSSFYVVPLGIGFVESGALAGVYSSCSRPICSAQFTKPLVRELAQIVRQKPAAAVH
jgi:hypothetical protein